jgi:hypothetical protein
MFRCSVVTTNQTKEHFLQLDTLEKLIMHTQYSQSRCGTFGECFEYLLCWTLRSGLAVAGQSAANHASFAALFFVALVHYITAPFVVSTEASG